MSVTEETYKIQSDLADYCRTNVLPDLPGLTPNRVQQYRRLVYNIIDDTLEGAYPITRSFLSEEEWHGLVNDFFAKHACKHPSIWKMPYEFYEFLSEKDHHLKDKYPFLTDLLYFEWLEIEVHTQPDEVHEKYREEGNWLSDRIITNRECRLVQLKYPVHQSKPDELLKDTKAGIYFVLIYREPASGNVQFFDLSPLYAFVITQLAETTNTLDHIIFQTSALFGLERTPDVEKNIIHFLEQLRLKQFVLGFAI
jgi:hypothetical protein